MTSDNPICHQGGSNAIMAGMAAALSDEDMKHLAAFFGSKKPVAGAAATELPEIGPYAIEFASTKATTR